MYIYRYRLKCEEHLLTYPLLCEHLAQHNKPSRIMSPITLTCEASISLTYRLLLCEHEAQHNKLIMSSITLTLTCEAIISLTLRITCEFLVQMYNLVPPQFI